MTALAILGASYLHRCLEVLSSPGTGLQFVIPGRGGPVTIRTGAYSVHMAAGWIRARDVAVINPSMLTVAQAERLDIRIPDLFGGPRKALDLKLEGVDAILERRADGKFAFLDLLPPETDEKSNLPFAIRVSNVRIRLIDRRVSPAFTESLRVSEGWIDGFGADWRASARVFQPDGGSVLFSARRNEAAKHLVVDASLGGFEAARYLDSLRRTPGADKWAVIHEADAAELVLRGSALVRVSDREPAVFQGLLDIRGSQVSYAGYRASTARSRAQLSHKGALGWIEASQTGIWARFAGRTNWEDQFVADGKLEARVDSTRGLPTSVRREFPKELDFRGAQFEGALAVDPASGPSILGSLKAQSARWGRHRVDEIKAMVQGNRKVISVRQAHGRFRGTAVAGVGDVRLAAKDLLFAASSEAVRIEQFHADLGTDRIFGPVQLSAAASGAWSNPRIEIRAKGVASARFEEGRAAELGAFSAIAQFSKGALVVDRLDVVGPAGVLSANGRFRMADQALEAQVVGSGLDLARLHSKLMGTATGRLELSGTPREFRAKGPVEVYGLVVADQGIPLLGADLDISPKRLVAGNIAASKGAARARGEVEWTFESGALNGRFDAESIQLPDLVAEGVEGSIDIANGRLNGTVEQPILEADARGKDLILDGVRIDVASASARLQGSSVALSKLQLQAGNGTLSATGNYDWNQKSGRVEGSAQSLPVDRLHALLPPAFSLEGGLHGSFNVEISENRISKASATGGFDEIGLNGVFFGSGNFEASGAAAGWTGAAEIGSPERYLQVEGLAIDPENKTVSARLTGFSLPMKDLYRAARPFAVRDPGAPESEDLLSPSLQDFLERIQGSLDIDLQMSGAMANPDVRIASLTLRDLQVDGEPAGQITGSGERKGENWKIEALKWSGGPATLDARGTFAENGNASIDGNLYNLDTQWLSRFLPGLSKLTGEATVFFTVTGPARKPQIEASLAGSLFEAGLTTGQRDKDKELKLDVYPILISDGEISMAGLFNYRGFSGELKGVIPFRYPFEFPEDRQMDVSLRVPKRPLHGLRDLASGLDPARTDGDVWADLSLTGTPNAIRVGGSIDLEAKSLGIQNADTSLRDVRAKTTFIDGKLQLSGTALSDKGGSLKAQGVLKLKSLDELFAATAEEFLSSSVEGSVQFNGFRIEEKDLPLDAAKTSLLSFSVRGLNGGIRVHGPLREPMISTFVPLALEGVKGEIPGVLVETGASSPTAMSPRFNLAYVVGTRSEPAEVRAAASVLNLYGGGVLKGRLEDLEANANLNLRSGHLRLPNARISLQEGGTVKLLYDSGRFDSNLRLDVDIEGRTALSTVRFGSNIERYDIFLELRGNLLNPDEQVIGARSDPPDLSQDRILNLLGQIELVEQISSQIVGAQQRSQLQQALGTLAIPVFFDPVTEALARKFGLEYLSLEYGPLAQTSVLAAKWLGRGFTLQGRREISEPIDGVSDYDLRLSYRPPRRIRSLRGLTFSAGMDQNRPWKISVEYGQRFGRPPSPTTPKIIRIGG